MSHELNDKRGKILTFKLQKGQLNDYMASCRHHMDCAVSVLEWIGTFDHSVIEKLAKKSSNGRGLSTEEYLNTIYKRYSTKNYEKVYYPNINKAKSELKQNEFTIVGGLRDKMGHLFIVGKNDSNKLFVFDPQSNVYYNKPSEHNEYLSNFSSFGLLYNTKQFHPLNSNLTLRQTKEYKPPSKKQRIRTHEEQLEKEIKEEKEKDDELVNEFEKMSLNARGLQKRRKTTRKTMKKTKRRGNIKRKNTRRDSKKYK
jgi:inorganic pyrophosphatase/exopolyphosphatase